MIKKRPIPDKEYLRRCKYSSAKSKLDWLSGALEFAYAQKVKTGKIPTAEEIEKEYGPYQPS